MSATPLFSNGSTSSYTGNGEDLSSPKALSSKGVVVGVAFLCCMYLKTGIITSTATSVPITERSTEHVATSTSDLREPEEAVQAVTVVEAVTTPVEAITSIEAVSIPVEAMTSIEVVSILVDAVTLSEEVSTLVVQGIE